MVGNNENWVLTTQEQQTIRAQLIAPFYHRGNVLKFQYIWILYTR